MIENIAHISYELCILPIFSIVIGTSVGLFINPPINHLILTLFTYFIGGNIVTCLMIDVLPYLLNNVTNIYIYILATSTSFIFISLLKYISNFNHEKNNNNQDYNTPLKMDKQMEQIEYGSITPSPSSSTNISPSGSLINKSNNNSPYHSPIKYFKPFKSSNIK